MASDGAVSPIGSGFSALIGILLAGTAAPQQPAGDGGPMNPLPAGSQPRGAHDPVDPAQAAADQGAERAPVPPSVPVMQPPILLANPQGLALAILAAGAASPVSMAAAVSEGMPAEIAADGLPSAADPAALEGLEAGDPAAADAAPDRVVRPPATRKPDDEAGGAGPPALASGRVGAARATLSPSSQAPSSGAADRQATLAGAAARLPSSSSAASGAPSASPPPALHDTLPPALGFDRTMADGGLEASPDFVEVLRGSERAGGSVDASPAPSRPSGNPAASQVEVHVARAAQGRIERLVVQLEPMELGKVEIRLEFGEEGRVGAVISAERPETLEALQRDSHALERSLRDAGLRPDGGSLSFDLRRGSPEGGRGGSGDGTAAGSDAASTEASSSAGREDEAGRMTSLRLLDIHA